MREKVLQKTEDESWNWDKKKKLRVRKVKIPDKKSKLWAKKVQIFTLLAHYFDFFYFKISTWHG